MRPARLALVVLGLAAASSRADWLLSDYATVAADSVAMNKIYGIQSFGNAASTTSVSAPEGGYARLSATFASDGTEGYSANLGMLHPLRKDWSAANITTATAVQFEFRYDKKPTGGVEVSLSSKLYPKNYSDSGFVHLYKVPTLSMPAVNTWKTITVPIASFLPPSWWCVEGSSAKPCPLDLPSKDAVLKSLQALQFAPKTTYTNPGTQKGVACTFCVTPTLAAVNLDIRNVKLVGYEETVPNPLGIGCKEAPSQIVETFADGDNSNDLGGYWFAFSDTSSAPAKDLDSARGSSTADMKIAAGDPLGSATLTTSLNKKVGGAFDWRPYAGWAAIGMGFEGSVAAPFPGLTGISFEIKALKLGPNVKGINFKVAIPGVSEATTHFAFLPAANIDPTNPKFLPSICVRPEDLMQPSWFAGAIPFSSDSIFQLSWEAKIADQADPLVATDTAAFQITNVAFHKDTARVGVAPRRGAGSFGASYRNGLLSVQLVPGFDHVSLVSPSGRVAARFSGDVRSQAVALDRGTWYVVARNAQGKTLVRTIAVMR